MYFGNYNKQKTVQMRLYVTFKFVTKANFVLKSEIVNHPEGVQL